MNSRDVLISKWEKRDFNVQAKKMCLRISTKNPSSIFSTDCTKSIKQIWRENPPLLRKHLQVLCEEVLEPSKVIMPSYFKILKPWAKIRIGLSKKSMMPSRSQSRLENRSRFGKIPKRLQIREKHQICIRHCTKKPNRRSTREIKWCTKRRNMRRKRPWFLPTKDTVWMKIMGQSGRMSNSWWTLPFMNKTNTTNIVTIGISRRKERWLLIKNLLSSIRNPLITFNRGMVETFTLPKKTTALKHLRPKWKPSIEEHWSKRNGRRTSHSTQWLVLKPGRWRRTGDSNRSSTKEIESNRKKKSTSSNWSRKSQVKLCQLIRLLTRLCMIASTRISTLFATRWISSVRTINKIGSLNQSSTIKWQPLCLVLGSSDRTTITTKTTCLFWSSGKRSVAMSTQNQLWLSVLSRISLDAFRTSTIRRSSTQKHVKITCLLLSAEQLRTVIYILLAKSNTSAKCTETSLQTDATKSPMIRKRWDNWNQFRRKCLAKNTSTHLRSPREQEPWLREIIWKKEFKFMIPKQKIDSTFSTANLLWKRSNRLEIIWCL